MMFTIFIALLFAGVVYIHYVKGFFDATLSAIIAIFAALLAFSWHEDLVETYFLGKYANISYSLVLVALFAVIYLTLRVIIDKLVPNGLLLPVMIDRIGGGVMGAIAAIFGIGILAIAIQELPFGPSIAGFSRYDTEDDKQVKVTRGSSQLDAKVLSPVKSNKAGQFDESTVAHIFPMVPFGIDEMVVNMVGQLSEGALSGNQALNRVHPNFLQEIFGQNIGIQAGASHVALPDAVKVEDLFSVRRVRLDDKLPHGTEIRGAPDTPGAFKIDSTPSTVVAVDRKPLPALRFANLRDEKATTLLVVRISFDQSAADGDSSVIRLSPGSIRLIAKKTGQSDKSNPQYMDYYPVGTLEPDVDPEIPSNPPVPVLYSTRLDDYLFLQFTPGTGRPSVDMVFLVDNDGVVGPIDNGGRHIVEGVVIEIKRGARFNLQGMKLNFHYAKPTSGPLGIMPEIKPRPVPTSAPAPQ